MPKFTRRTSLLLLVGVAAGFLSGLFGVGGGILVVPGLIVATKMDQRLAHGTSLAAVLPISFASLLTYWANDHVDWSVGAFLALGSIFGAIIGAKLLAIASKQVLSTVFIFVLIVSGVKLLFSTHGDGRDALSLIVVIVLIAIGFATGALAGMLGVGGGIIMVPAMIVLFGIPSAVAKGTSLAVIIPTAISGTLRNRKNSNADLVAAAIVGATGIISAVAGGWVSARMSDSLSNTLFAIFLLLIAIRMGIQARATAAVEGAA
jgi:uncharacterized membrane protein YfcA